MFLDLICTWRHSLPPGCYGFGSHFEWGLLQTWSCSRCRRLSCPPMRTHWGQEYPQPFAPCWTQCTLEDQSYGEKIIVLQCIYRGYTCDAIKGGWTWGGGGGGLTPPIFNDDFWKVVRTLWFFSRQHLPSYIWTLRSNAGRCPKTPSG